MKIIFTIAFVLLAFSFSAFAQDKMENMDKAKPTDADKVAEFNKDGKIVRGAALGNSKKVSLAKVLEDPGKFAGQTVRVEGVIVRSCKMEGCWMELAPDLAGKSVRVKFKDHSFFIPLQSAGFLAKAEGVFSVKTLSKEEVDHLVNDDGAKFENINEDGTVTEVAFEASGVELRKAK
ncbi:MAG: DUF4920 domain-containing protein [Pyrinomonadaceae bacterium]|nr:DUF4920 domain-containing protein [Pyrinomonadaceae bacterium]